MTYQTDKNTATALYDLITGDEDARVCKDIPEESCKHQPANFLLHLATNFFTKLADELASARLVFPWVLALLGAPMLLIGLAVPIREAGVLLPQLFIAAKIREKPVRKYVWMFGGILSALALWACALALIMDAGPQVASTVVFVALLVFSLARGICSVAAKDVLGKTVSKSRRGTLMGTATTISGVFTLLLGLNLGFYNTIQANALVLAALLAGAGFCWLLGSLCIANMREEPGATEGGGNAGVVALQSLHLLISDAPFRNFVICRTLLLSVSLGIPMVVVLAQANTNATGLIGLLLLMAGLANTVSGYVWGRLADVSSRLVMGCASALNALTIVAMMILLEHFTLADELMLYAGVYFVLSVCLAGVRLGRKTLLVDMATPEKRSAYVAVSNTIIGGLILLVGAAVALLSQQDVQVMLWAFAAMAALAAVLCPWVLPSQQAGTSA
ncbi:MFS transporter [Limnobacter sp.]|uniref:MFS transporter n=1 Tax=Limnobacter sp. TaxID=2003368 RepID=UPI003513BF59